MLGEMALLLTAMIAVESGGDSNAVNEEEDAVGVLQIRPIMVEECNRIIQGYGGRKEWRVEYALADRKCESMSRGMAVTYINYWLKYWKRAGKEPTLEMAARMWNGGPEGIRKESTLPYWVKVKAEMDKLRREGKHRDF